MEIKKILFQGNLILQIAVGLLVGILFALFFPEQAKMMEILGDLFLSALKAAAPVLVFFLIISAISNFKSGQKTSIKSVLWLYFIGTFLAALAAVFMSFLFPSQLIPKEAAEQITDSPSDIIEVLKTILLKLVDNPVSAIINSNFMGILVWATGIGVAFKHAGESTKKVFSDISEAITFIVRIIIRFAPVGIFGLVTYSIASTGVDTLKDYLHVLGVLCGTVLLVALVINPIIVFFKIKKNPFPLVFTCLKESGLVAFFTRSSAANIPVNMELSKKLKLNEDTYSVTIPLGATINMQGAAITINIMTLATVHTLGIEVDIWSVILLSFLSALCACGASGVPGGSLLLIPVACNLFDIPSEIAWQVVGIGLIISVLQDSMETALNSSTDVLFTAAACIADEEKG
ncbi:MAG: serine/threonine transporter SstT [Flavobacteriaceae bacterium]|jgi:serine/threonine transporter|nr:serine/threonine transporter SstT [Flavobacteriaceae bacterium]